MNEIRIAVIGKDDRPIGCEQVVKFGIGDPVRMLVLGLQRHQVDDVHDTDLQVGQVFAQQGDRRERLQRWNVAGEAITTSGSLPSGSLEAQSQIPMPTSQCRTASSMGNHWGAGCTIE